MDTMQDASKTLADTNFHNWLRVAIAVCIVKKGIEKYVLSVITKFHEEALKNILSSEQIIDEALCSTCTTEVLTGSKTKPTNTASLPRCPNKICDQLRTKVVCSHAHGNPSWKNTRVERWCRSPWEIAKCYMPPSGYLTADSEKETDLNGILSVMMNHLEFRQSGVDVDSCTKARKVTNAVRHSPNLSMDDQEWKSHVDILIKFIDCRTYLENNDTCQTALENLKKLKEQKLPISSSDVIEVLTENVRDEIKECTDQSIRQIEEKKNQWLRETIEDLSKREEQTSEHLEKILTQALEEIQHKSESLQKIVTDNAEESYETRKAHLKEDLLTFNKKLHSTIPLSPLFEKRDTPLLGFYVQPNINCIEYPMGETVRSDIKTEINNLCDIFKTRHCNEIYVTSKAGLGKTVFCKRLVVTWCQAHSTGASQKQYVSEADVDKMKGFEYVFLVLLRETRATDCEVDKMIHHQIVKYLARSKRYNLSFLQDVLTKETCLIILDGLDEWTHPKRKSCTTTNDIPHRQARENCTILTTTRTWKFCLLALSTNQIDVHVQITGLGEKAAEQLVDNAVSKFNPEDISKIKSNIDDFHNKIQEERSSKFKSVPLILIHLIHLWRIYHTFGDSLCKIFSNITELHLYRLKIKSKSKPPVSKKKCTELPECIAKNSNCSECYDDVLKPLGQLAFETYFSKDRENSLVFDVSTAKKYLGKYFEYCLATGLLTQHKSFTDDITEEKSRMSFAHKTFQEYFAALYLFTVFNTLSPIQKVMDICKSEKDILSVSQFYIFLCGICPSVARNLALRFHDVISNCNTVKGYRSDMGSWNYFVGYNETIKKLQNVFVEGANESMDNGHEQVEFRMDDIIIDSDFKTEKYSSALRTSLEKNGTNIKSVKIRDVKSKEEFSDITKLVRKGGKTALEKLDLKCELCEESLQALLHSSAKTLKCFIIKGGRWLGNIWSHDHISLGNDSLQTICNMKQLEELYLRNIVLTHGQLELVTKYVSECSHMKHIGLGFLKCKKHDYHCSGIYLDLSNHKQLRMLEIGSLPISEVKINTHSLEVCYVGNFEHSAVLPEVLTSLKGAQKLHVFCCGFLTRDTDIDTMLNTVPFLTHLQHLWLINMDLGRKQVQLNSSMVNIENVFMIRVKMDAGTLAVLKEEASAVDQTLRVGLFDCAVGREDEYENEIGRIRQSHTLHVVQEESRNQKDFVFKTVCQASKAIR